MTKLCLTCLIAAPIALATCLSCGEASWSAPAFEAENDPPVDSGALAARLDEHGIEFGNADDEIGALTEPVGTEMLDAIDRGREEQRWEESILPTQQIGIGEVDAFVGARSAFTEQVHQAASQIDAEHEDEQGDELAALDAGIQVDVVSNEEIDVDVDEHADAPLEALAPELQVQPVMPSKVSRKRGRK